MFGLVPEDLMWILIILQCVGMSAGALFVLWFVIGLHKANSRIKHLTKGLAEAEYITPHKFSFNPFKKKDGTP